MPADTPLQTQKEIIELPAEDVHNTPRPSPPAPQTPYSPEPKPVWRKPAPSPTPMPKPAYSDVYAEPDPIVTLVVNGLQKMRQPGWQPGFFEEKLEVSFYTTLPKINDMLVKKGLRTTSGVLQVLLITEIRVPTGRGLQTFPGFNSKAQNMSAGKPVGPNELNELANPRDQWPILLRSPRRTPNQPARDVQNIPCETSSARTMCRFPAGNQQRFACRVPQDTQSPRGW